MLAQRTLWAIAMILVTLGGLVAVGMSLTRPDAVADKYLPAGAPGWIVPALAAADALTYVVLPFAALVGLVRRASWTSAVLWTAAGATAYTFVAMLGATLVAGAPAIAPLSAIPPLGIYLAAALSMSPGRGRQDGRVSR